jgi:hypothetical protein
MRGLALAAILAAMPAAAQEARPTPDYFAEAVFDMSTAQALARSCTRVSVDPIAAAARSELLLTSLDRDGFSLDAPHEQMDDPDAAIRALQTAFVERYALDKPGEERVCDVALAEIAAGSGIGMLLADLGG